MQRILILSLALIGGLLPSNLDAATDAELEAYLKTGSSRLNRGAAGEYRFGVDFSGVFSIMDYEFLNTDANGSKADWTGNDIAGDDFQIGYGMRAFVETNTQTYAFSFQGLMLESYSVSSGQDYDFGGATIPAGSDLDAKSSINHLLFENTRMPWQLDQEGAWHLGWSWGIAYDIIEMELNSDAFPIADGVQDMGELWPYPVVGAHINWQANDRLEFTLSARFGFMPSIGALSDRDGEDLEQESTHFELALVERFHLNDWFVIGGSLRYQSFSHTLTGDGPSSAARTNQEFDMSLMSATLDFGFRF